MKKRTKFSKDWDKYQEISFTKTESGIYPDKQLAKSFLISTRLIDMDAVECEPLTFFRFARAVVVNFAVINFWRGCRLLFKWGFLNTPEAEPAQWKHLTLPFLKRNKKAAGSNK